jgi:uncharacterized protein YggE
MTHWRKTLAVFGFTLCTFTAQAQEAAQLSVRGMGTIFAKPDQVSMTVGVTAQNKSAEAALEENSKRMRAIISAMKKLGLKDKEYSTQQFQVHPVWESRPRNASHDWRAEIIAFRVSNSLMIKSGKLKLAGDIIADAMAAGANQVNGIHFGLADPRQYREQAIAAAMKTAREDADNLAKAAGMKITGVIQLQLDDAATTPVFVQEHAMMRSAVAMDMAMAPPIQSGDVEVNATVTASFSVE